ncbi:MAG: OadG family protein [Deltaproteobacteria bacterium]|jgi:sodium pump decarboxylase gamma subunit|nr:OadG family protein [Deltaproteobacteria bacterium]
MNDGLFITATGMGVVFSVLIIIMISVIVLSALEPFLNRLFKVEPEFVRPVRKKAAAKTTITDDEQAAIKAALAHHTGMKVDSFDLKIK